jgi:uncharacterized membrane protein YhaH (DUF805 family)
MEWMLLPLKRYAEFSGRSRRKEYWMFAVLNIIVFIVLGFLAAVSLTMTGNVGGMVSGEGGLGAVGGGMGSMVAIALCVLWGLAVIVPSIAVQVRRFHDQDKSGWWALINFVPYVGSLIVLVFMLMDGTAGPNKYGADPKAGTAPS